MTEQEARKLKGFLGLCQRAGQVILGQDACVDAVRRKTAALVLLDVSSTDVSKKRFRNACLSHHVPLYGVPRGLIAQALGKDGRMAAAIRQGTMAEKLKQL
ncbi:MAG: ribosomal L7Ae/L30e/S12e/Gadd45 family protein, partial [Bacillota bacterium]